jgi:hypothetical protein
MATWCYGGVQWKEFQMVAPRLVEIIELEDRHLQGSVEPTKTYLGLVDRVFLARKETHRMTSCVT